jgi:Domain of unknown function (DUF1707)
LTAVTEPGLRASDADRQRVISALERHTAAGRLTLDEFGERVAQVLASVTHPDLRAVIADLPPDPGIAEAESAAESEARRAHARQLAIAFALAVVTLIVLGIVLTLGR